MVVVDVQDKKNIEKLFIEKSNFFVVGRLGLSSLKFIGKDVIIRGSGVKVTSYLNKVNFDNFIKNTLYILKYGYYIELSFFGLGYRVINLLTNMLIKLGLGHYVKVYNIKGVYMTGFKRKLFIYGVNKNIIKVYSILLSRLKVLDVYKGKGLNFKNVTIKLKNTKNK